MRTSQKALFIVGLVVASGVLASCATHTPAQTQAAVRIDQAELNGTVLDAFRPTVAAVESRMQVGMPGASGLTAEEHARLQAFAREFIQLGRGNVAVSVPMGTDNQAAATQIATETQRALFAYGVDYGKMGAVGYQATGPYAPITLSFTRYEARAVECVPWSQIEPRAGVTNGAHARLGCASAGNLAAMVADPGDLLADRTPDGGDAGRVQTGMDALRKGELAKASGSVKGGE
jgi:pilus assembly protein CpaD